MIKIGTAVYFNLATFSWSYTQTTTRLNHVYVYIIFTVAVEYLFSTFLKRDTRGNKCICCVTENFTNVQDLRLGKMPVLSRDRSYDSAHIHLSAVCYMLHRHYSDLRYKFYCVPSFVYLIFFI